MPTSIEVTLEGKKPVYARCAVDALGISKMMGRRATVVATTRDGVALQVEIDGAELIRAAPAEAVVHDGGSCDEMVFFSSAAALDQWKQAHRAQGRSIPLVGAVRLGAKLFGRINEPIRGAEEQRGARLPRASTSCG